MTNIKFNYLYRDGSNYKKYADVVFSNPTLLSIDLITRKLKKYFLEDGLFIAHQVRIPEVFLALDGGLTVDDHCYHEFDLVEMTGDPPSDTHNRSIQEFLPEVANEGSVGWRAFDPQNSLPRLL
jgi:hypothetical protein